MSIISKDIIKAKEILSNEELVAIPTETVYGLAGNIYSEKAINAIFTTKKRPLFNPLIVHIPNKDYLTEIAAEIPLKAQKLADAFWPGPLTLVLPKKSHIPNIITAGKDTVAVRIPNHKTTLALLTSLDFPLAAPSANPFGKISPTRPEHVANYFGRQLKMVLDGGPCQRGIESTIIGFENGLPIIYRLGSISKEVLEEVVGTLEIKNKKEISPDAPGMLDRHYAPQTKIILVDDIKVSLKNHANKKIGVLTFTEKLEDPSVDFQLILSETGDYKEAASNLYEALHEFDQQDLDIIIAERLPNKDLGLAINDRLTRATK